MGNFFGGTKNSPEKFILVWLGGIKIITCTLWWDNFGFYLQPLVGQKKVLATLGGTKTGSISKKVKTVMVIYLSFGKTL